MRTRPMPMPPTLAPGCMTQYSTLGRCATYRERSARNRMFIDPPTPILPSNGRPACSATRLFPPSAPTRYFERIVMSLPVSRSRQVVVTPSASCTWVRYSVLILGCAPREQAVLKRIGSMKVCGRSFISQGLERRCSAFDSGLVPQDCMRPSSSPARETQNTLLPINSCGAACSIASASTSGPRSRSTSIVRWLVMWARGVLASQR